MTTYHFVPDEKDKKILAAKPDDNNIVLVPQFRTFDFADMEGKPQTDEANEEIHDNIANYPDHPMIEGGESFDEAAQRVLPLVEKLLKTNKVIAIVTHNSVYGMIKLWYEEGKPRDLNLKFRHAYIEEDNTNPTGSYICMKSDNGSEVYLIRHGETEDNAEHVFRTPGAKLTKNGMDQALDVGNELKDEGITKIYSSDLPRAVETARIIQSVNETNNSIK